MAPGGRERPSPLDKFTDASPSAITSGFSAAMAIGPQPKAGPSKGARSSGPSLEGADWLRSLQEVSGVSSNNSFSGTADQMGTSSGIAGTVIGEEDDFSEEEDGDSELDSPAGGGRKKARKSKGKPRGPKVTNDDSSAAQRKAQNRIAQREFRQRKQQYIRALEARVELLSSDHDTQVDRLRFALRGLLAENNQLRSMLGSFASFVGTDMIGGPLQKAGLSRAELMEMISNSSEKTMTQTWQNWPGARECEALRQIRLESNLPPEGLPESQKLPEHAIANTAAAASKMNTLEGAKVRTSSGDTEKEAKTKRKGAGEEEGARKVKQRQPKPVEDHSHGDGTTHSAPLNFGAPTESPSMMADMASFAGSTDGAPLAKLFSQSGFPHSFSSPSASAGYPHAPGLLSPSQNQDPNAILASLLGMGDMGKYMGQQLPNSSPGQLPVLASPSDGNGVYLANIRQKTTTANVEEPEEIKRLHGLAARIGRDFGQFGQPKEEAELSGVVDAVSRLIYQMASFRRQPSYHLPSLLEPSDIQQTRPHDPLLDALPFSGLRHGIIMHQDNLLVEDVVVAFLYHAVVHRGDAMTELNWELREGFFFAYPQLIDRQTLANVNQWRWSRNEPPHSIEHLSSRSQ